ncbi:MAG: MCE family protein [Acidobacteria bacterium]|nr:MCE family protein [Acidobacteriota bacterium]
MKELKTGMIVFLALVVFVVTVLMLGEFGDRVTYIIDFPKVVGLTIDAPVQLNGVQVGRVTDIEFSKDVKSNLVSVTVNLFASAKSRINRSTIADISTMGVLGDKYIALETKDFSLPPLPENAVIQTKKTLNVQGMLTKGEGIIDDLSSLTRDMNQLVAHVKKGKGLVGVLINNPEIGKNLVDSISIVSRNLSEGTGLVGKLINDKALCETVATGLDNISYDLTQILDNVNAGKGTAGLLLKNQTFADKIKTDTLSVMDGLNALGKLLSKSSEKSIAAVALQDGQAGKDLKAAIHHLRSILEKIDNGEGTMGKLVNDTSLYDNADQVFRGAKKSALTRTVIRHYKKKGKKERD